jgi:hypothetical protein
MAYTLSLAHSVIPHHHHKTEDEASAHKHSDHHHDKHEHHHSDHEDSNTENENSEDTGHFFFFSHDANIDVLVKHSSIDKPVNLKKTQPSITVKQQVISFEISKHLVFHPPQGETNFISAVQSTLALRGPPSC